MTLIEKLENMGYEKANRILAEKVMGWKYVGEGMCDIDNTYYTSYQFDGVLCFKTTESWSPCTDLNHTKMVVDELSYHLARRWLNIMLDMFDDGIDSTNAPADVRMAAVFEALNLWEEK